MSYQAILDRATNQGTWLFQEVDGAIAEDASGNERDGSIFGSVVNQTGPTDWLPRAFFFDGIDDYVDCGNDAALLPELGVDDFSLGAWVRPASADEAGYLLGTAEFSDSTNRGTSIYWDGAEDQLVLSSGTSLSLGARSNAVFTEDDEWVFVGVSVVGNTATFYKNGVASGSGTAVSRDPGAQSFLIGNRNGGTSAGTFFSGLMAAPLAFSEALSGPDWAKLFAGPGGIAVPPPLFLSMTAGI